ncbi:unnamed protein product [Lepeophtheirus salmonis]|uniref:(salmon louse) hypothetical protein n=1 Tax=Lepeophtheirus salmonis TaxID=72036 RepID=A0A7R8CJL5_LEPSM|nr:unnamed protein product [Lepeophtheirus salmonis]CAF2807094.1 unnamed protein product [Lepeophtheirus salmonis]
MIGFLGTEVRRMIINRINTAGMFGISADTTPDLSCYDQITVLARYVKDMTPYERLLALKHVKSKTWEDIYYFSNIEQPTGINNIVSQSYDFAASMSGQYNINCKN